jgi:cytochrome c-type biogenesis protein CcmH
MRRRYAIIQNFTISSAETVQPARHFTPAPLLKSFMPSFYIASALMLVVALGFVILPLLRSGRAAMAGRIADTESNVAIYRQQCQEILDEFESAVLTVQERDDALAELTLRAGQEVVKGVEVQVPAVAPATAQVRLWAWAAGVAVLVPLLTFGLYAKLGSPDATKLAVAGTHDAPASSEKQILGMVDSLAEKMKNNPDDVQGWALLGRSQRALERWPQAADAFERANQLSPNDAQLLADYADVLAMTQQGNLNGKPFDLILQALKADPENRKALALAGTAELNRRNFGPALAYWERLQKLLPAGSEDQRQVDATIEEIRQAQGGGTSPGPAGSTVPVAPAVQNPAPAADTAAKSVSGKVTISPELAKQIAPTDTVFIFAHSAQQGGPKMPLAALRVQAKELPRQFELTDSMAMTPNFKISGFAEVVVEARVSKSGNPSAQNGDFQGATGIIKPGAKGVSIVIDRVIK